MKYMYLFVAALSLAACSKNESNPEVFDPLHPKTGQEAELFIDHYVAPLSQRIFVNTNRTTPLAATMDKFNRDLGYTYVVKATVVTSSDGLAGAPAYWFEYKSTIRKDKYQGTDTIALPLFSTVAPLAAFYLTKNGDVFNYYGSAPLRPVDASVKAAIEEAYAKGTELMTAGRPNTIMLYALHDPENYTKGYVVYRVAL